MVIIEWNEGLSVGDPLIDEQHKMLLKRLNDISTAIETDQGIDDISKTLNFMMEYTEFHFSAEEKRMEDEKYPRLEYHKSQHKEFVKTLNDLSNDFFEDGATQSLAEAINVFLFNWLVKHIKGVDGAFGRFLSETR